MPKFHFSRQNLNAFLVGGILGLPLALSVSGHFLRFWLRRPEVKTLILVVMIPLLTVLLGSILLLIKKPAKFLKGVYVLLFLIVVYEVWSVSERFERFGLPPGVVPEVTLTLAAEEKQNPEAVDDSVKLMRIMLAEKDSAEAIFIGSQTCNIELTESNDESRFTEIHPGAGLQCSFIAQPGSEVRLVFIQAPESGYVKVSLHPKNEPGDSVSFDLYSPQREHETYKLLVPLSSFFLFLKCFDLISMVTVLTLLSVLVVSRLPVNPNGFVLLVLLLHSINLIYFMLFPMVSGYTIAKDRYDYQFSEWKGFEQLVRDVNRFVPPDTGLAIIYPGKYPVSPLFGPAYTRRLLPQYPAPAEISASALRELGAEYLLMDAQLFEKNLLGFDGQLHFTIYGGGEVLYPYYSLDDLLQSGVEIIASCARESACGYRYYLFRARK